MPEVIDGYLIDDQGEVLGLDRPFAVNSDDTAEWLLRERMEAEAAVLAINQRRAGYMANLDSLAAPHKARLAYFARVLEPQLIEFARSKLDGKSKTAKFDHGQVAYRKTGLSITVTNPAGAVAFVRSWRPDEVRESVDINSIKVCMVDCEIERGIRPDISTFAQVKTEGESVTIKTGIPKAKEKT